MQSFRLMVFSDCFTSPILFSNKHQLSIDYYLLDVLDFLKIIVTITNYHKRKCLKQCKFNSLQFFRLEIAAGLTGLWSRCQQGSVPLYRRWGTVVSLLILVCWQFSSKCCLSGWGPSFLAGHQLEASLGSQRPSPSLCIVSYISEPATRGCFLFMLLSLWPSFIAPLPLYNQELFLAL